MSRRLLALVCALALVGAVAPAATAFGDDESYIHIWQAEGMVGGDLGGTARKTVQHDDATLSFEDGAFTGGIRYEDALVVQAASGVMTAQFASIDVTLTGTSAEGGAKAAGSFAGTASLVTRPARSLDDVRDRTGAEVAYEVSGHWGAVLENGVARGELLFERATPLPGAMQGADVHDALWFDRLSAEKGGGAQSIEIEVAGLVPGTKPRSGPAIAPPATALGPGVLEYVRRGLVGQPVVPAPPPVPLAFAQRARALKTAAPVGAVELPANAVAMDADLPGAYLDAKDRAAGLACAGGPTGVAGSRLAKAWAAPERRYAAFLFTGAGRASALQARFATSPVPGASELASDLAAPAESSDATAVRLWAGVVGAVEDARPSGSVLRATVAELDAVRSASLPRSGGLADAVRVAHGDIEGLAPSAYSIPSMKREPSIFSTAPVSTLVSRMGVPLEKGDAASLDSGVQRWNGYRRADGTLYWLGAPADRTALVDGELAGAGFTTTRAFLVDATDVGRILAVYPPR